MTISQQEPKVVYKTATQINEQKEQNKPAEARYAKNPDGNDNFDLVKDGELLVVVNSHQHQQEPQLHHVRLNKNAIYYSEKGVKSKLENLKGGGNIFYANNYKGKSIFLQIILWSF